jgi:hypothetical protein
MMMIIINKIYHGQTNLNGLTPTQKKGEVEEDQVVVRIKYKEIQKHKIK